MSAYFLPCNRKINKEEWNDIFIKFKLLILSNYKKKFKNDIDLDRYINIYTKKVNGNWRKDGVSYKEALTNAYEKYLKKTKKIKKIIEHYDNNKELKKKIIEHYDINKELKKKVNKLVKENKKLYETFNILSILLKLNS